jgi:tetratricopeptide (TPR) repeat protein
MTKAIELAPTQADYYYQRGVIHQQNRQSPAALNDMQKAVELDPGHIPGRVARAGLLLSRLQSTGAGRIEDVKADIDVARSATSPESDTHFELGQLYANVGEQERSLESFLTWLRFHRDDSRAAEARAMSCRARALLNQDLDQALDDCNSAVRDRPDSPPVLEACGLAHLRLGNFDRAISDYDKVLAEQPRNAWALYGRGIAKLRIGKAAEGQADIAAARAANPRTVQNALTRGLVP